MLYPPSFSFDFIGLLYCSFVFEEKIFGGAVPKAYFPAVRKRFSRRTKHGILAQYPVLGIKATLIDGSYHSVDSSEMAFKTATIMCLKKLWKKQNQFY